jgi:hypothetical protein
VVRAPDRELRDNPRYVVTNPGGPKHLYENIHCQRGEIENRIKHLHHGLEIDRTSCTDFWANQLRVLLTATRLCAHGRSSRRGIPFAAW